MKLVLIITALFAALLSQANGANILFFIGMGSYSHRVPLQPLMDALAERGHNVTMLSGFPPKVPNPKVKEFSPPKLSQWAHSTISDEFDVFKFRKNSQILMAWLMLLPLGVAACESLYSDPEVIEWMKDSSTKFDVVVMDSLANECALGLAYHFNAKFVAFNTGQMYVWNLESNYGLPDETSSIPDGMLHMPMKMNFFQRAATAVIPLLWKAYRELWFFPKLEEITKNGLGLKEVPSFAELETNTSLYLVNNHWALEFPRSLPPNVVPVGGIAWQNKGRKPLPKKLEDFINKGKEGFIYVSFGTVAEFTKFDPAIRQAFINMIDKFPNIQFIWKSTHPIQEKLPSNVLVDKWLPQADILTHPKIRFYVTHGGLGGVYEAIYSKVPMICFPVFAEQEFNADLMVNKGYGIKLELITLTEPVITEAISKILSDPSYKRNVEKVARILTDRPNKPLDTAVWWMEFIIRNENPNEYIRPLSATQSWWVRRQLDVWVFLLLVALVAISIPILILRCLIKFILKKLFGGSEAGSKKTKTKRAKLIHVEKVVHWHSYYVIFPRGAQVEKAPLPRKDCSPARGNVRL